MIDPVELEISRAVQAMRQEAGIVDAPPSNVIEFPATKRAPYGVVQVLTQKCADALLVIEALGDLMALMVLEAEQKNASRQIIIDMLKKGETAARNALDRLEG